jgi:hypothetical protein
MKVSRFFVALLALSALPAFSQDVRARVQGLVTDSTQAVIVGAQIVLTNEGTNVAAVTRSNNSGQYLFDFVIGGNYSVTVEMQGFRKCPEEYRREPRRCHGDAPEIGSATEAVTVDASPVAVQFNTSTMA